MQRALALARRGQGRVEPNPMVGCVLVRTGKVVGEGYHRRYGGPHAEIDALRSAGKTARGATAYVTLEPCCHHGKTPPCTKELIDAGVARVVAAMRDPFGEVSGRGLRQVRRAGIDVRVGVGEAEARLLNAPYLKRLKTGLPWVVLKWAQSLDGKVATRTGDSKWISGEQSRRKAHQLRGRVDGIIVGVQTVVDDDPELTCRDARAKRTAKRIVIDPDLRIPPQATLVRTAQSIETLVVTDRDQLGSAKAVQLEQAGVELMGLRRVTSGLDLRGLLKRLGAAGMTNVMVEGGGSTLGRFVDAGLADEAMVFVANRLIGGAEARPALGGLGARTMQEAIEPKHVRTGRCGADSLYELRLTDPIDWR